MLEHVPTWLGQLLGSVRAGPHKLASLQADAAANAPDLSLASPAFAHGSRLPERFTADGAGISPPLVWADPPTGTQAFALIVEDPDAPAPRPLVHALLWNIDVAERRLAEGALSDQNDVAGDIGRNSYLQTGWLPPDPPSGHGQHDYVFQLFALRERTDLGDHPGRSDVLNILPGQVLAVGLLVGTYERGDVEHPAPLPGRAEPAA